MRPRVIVFSGYGINSEAETAYGFELAGAKVEIRHLNEIIENKNNLSNFQIISFPGGFSYGDDTGAGKAYASKLRNHLWGEIYNFIEKDKLVIGICNGCQIIANLGLVPAFEKNYGDQKIALIHNDSSRLTTRWIDMKVTARSPWLAGIEILSLPISHGEGKFYADKTTLGKLRDNKQIALHYISGDVCNYLNLPANPNGSIEDIAGVIDKTGRILGLMPHPERGMFFVQRPDWQLRKEEFIRKNKLIPEFSDGLSIFANAVNYFA